MASLSIEQMRKGDYMKMKIIPVDLAQERIDRLTEHIISELITAGAGPDAIVKALRRTVNIMTKLQMGERK